MIIRVCFPFVSYSTQVLFRVVPPLKQTTLSCRACRHSSLSSWLLRDGSCIPIRGLGSFIPAGRTAVPPACNGNIPACVSLLSSVFPAFQGFSSYSWSSPDSQVSAVSQDIPVQLWHAVRVHRPRQEVCKFLVPPGFSPIPWCPVFIQRHKIMCPFGSVFVQVGGICVVPVLLKLLLEHTLSRELFLKPKRTTSEKSSPILFHTEIETHTHSNQISCLYFSS